MVNATVDNAPVSVELRHNESVTVPVGEVWNVTISIAINDREDSSSGYGGVAVNNSNFLVGNSDGEYSVEAVLTGSDTVDFYTGSGGSQQTGGGYFAAYISGFVVSN
jgi:hypothetical protein